MKHQLGRGRREPATVPASYSYQRTGALTLILTVVGVCCWQLLLHPGRAAAQYTPSCPAGWSRPQAGRGVALCQRGDFYVTVVDLSSGARIRNMYQFAGSAGSASNPNPLFVGRDIREWWAWSPNVANKPAGALFGMTNGAFFSGSYPGNPADHRFSFPMKDRGLLRTIGGDHNPANPLREFRMNDADAGIEYYPQNPNSWDQVNSLLGRFTSVVGLHPGTTDDGVKGRTYLGLRDNNGDGRYETVYIFSSRAATKPDAYNSLTNYFRTVVNIQFDGSGSAQMMCRGNEYVVSTDIGRRNVPHGFAIYEAP